MVREGDYVRAGQTLVRLNATRAQAEQGVISSQYITAAAIEARLIAERDGLDRVKPIPAVQERFDDDPRFIRATRAQERLFETRRQALKGENEIGRASWREKGGQYV